MWPLKSRILFGFEAVLINAVSHLFFLNFFRFIYFLTLIKIFIFNIITFIYYITHDLILLVINKNFLIFYPNNYLE